MAGASPRGYCPHRRSDGSLSARQDGVHISDYRLAALIHMHMLDADDLRAIVSQAPQGFDLGCVAAQQSGCPRMPATLE